MEQLLAIRFRRVDEHTTEEKPEQIPVRNSELSKVMPLVPLPGWPDHMPLIRVPCWLRLRCQWCITSGAFEYDSTVCKCLL